MAEPARKKDHRELIAAAATATEVASDSSAGPRPRAPNTPRTAGAELITTTRMMRLVLDTIPVRLFWKDRDLNYLGCNLAFALDAGFDNPEDLLGKNDYDMGWAEQAELYRADDRRVIESGAAVLNIEEPQTTPDGNTIWLRTSKIPLLNADNEIIGVLGTYEDISDRKLVEGELKMHRNHLEKMVAERTADLIDTQRKLVAASHEAGMAEVATNVLHNVGNVLNNVSVAAGLIFESLEADRSNAQLRALDLLEEHRDHLTEFINDDPRGKQLFGYMRELAKVIGADREHLRREMKTVVSAMEHIGTIVRVQQDYAKSDAVIESCVATDIAEDVLRINADAFERHRIEVVREFEELPTMGLARHKLMQILVNLVTNAQEAIEAAGDDGGTIHLKVSAPEPHLIRFDVRDSGIGIPPENCDQLFRFGFSTRPDGHGYGLHAAANSAGQLGGQIEVASDGPGCGATFSLTVPVRSKI